MARQEFLLPKLGESITEATIISWAKEVGDFIEEDETLLEIATDKVDSELPSPFQGEVVTILYKEGDVVAVGSTIAIIETEEEGQEVEVPLTSEPETDHEVLDTEAKPGEVSIERLARPGVSNRFYSPLVRAIAEIEQLSITDLDQIHGSGEGGRVSKKDVVHYVKMRSKKANTDRVNYESVSAVPKTNETTIHTEEVEIVKMDRMRKLIADHMVRSKQTAPHVTSFLEIDITRLVDWRERVKEDFKNKQGQKITYTPIFIQAVAKAISNFSGINASVDGDNIILRKSINIGMATATASGNLIVPVLKNVDRLSLLEIITQVNDLADRARRGALRPDEIQGGTFTLTNVGTFGNTMGTPIINQPQVAILSTGAIRKKPAVIETEKGDEFAVRKFMFLSLSYDHRIVDGALGGSFLRRVGDLLEGFDDTQYL